MWVTKSENEVYQLSRPPRLSEPSHEIFLDLALGIQDLLPLLLDILTCPGGLT